MPELEVLSFGAITWNVHRGRGNNKRNSVDPERIYRAIEEEISPLAPDVVALQEADSEVAPHAAIVDPERIAEQLGLQYGNRAPSMRNDLQSSGFCGTVMFLSADFSVTHQHVVDLPGHWHRGAVVIETERHGRPVRLVTAHLSRLETLRIAQMRTLGQYVKRRPTMPTVLMGDINDWQYWSAPAFHRKIVGMKLVGPKRPTYPVGRPFLPLDRIVTDAPGGIEATRVLDSPLLRIASDHRPLWARVRA